MRVLLVVVVCLFASGPLRAADSSKPSDRAYRNGVIFTANAAHDTAQAIAIHDGKIVYVGPDSGLDAWIGPSTELVDLHGRFLMPGIVDGHMHPLQAGAQLLKCGLDYASLTVRGVSGTRAEVPGWIGCRRTGQVARSGQLVPGEHATRRCYHEPRNARRVENETADHRPLVVRPHGAREHARTRSSPTSPPIRKIRSAARSGATHRVNRPACSKTPRSTYSKH